MKHQTSKELLEITTALLQFLGVTESEIQVEESERHTFKIQIDSPHAPLIIGKHGETLLALQHVIKAVYKKNKEEEEIILIVDVGHYRQQHENKILQMTQVKAEKVLAENIKETLFPMNSYHRRIVHNFIASRYPEIETGSVGEEPNRRITLKRRENGTDQ